VAGDFAKTIDTDNPTVVMEYRNWRGLMKEVNQKMSEEVRLDDGYMEQEPMKQAIQDSAADDALEEAPTAAAPIFGAQSPQSEVQTNEQAAQSTVTEEWEAGISESRSHISELDLNTQAEITDAMYRIVTESEQDGTSMPILDLKEPYEPESEISAESEKETDIREPESTVQQVAADAEEGTLDIEDAPEADKDVPEDANIALEPEASAEQPETRSDQEEPSEPPVDKAVAETESAETTQLGESAFASESFEEMLEKSIITLHTGQKVSGVVTSVTSTEVSVDLGTKQSGYIPISEFADDASTKIEDVIKVGDTIESFVMRVNDVEGMVVLSKKRLDAIKNWDIIEAAKENRAIVEGFVTEENKGGIVVNVKGVRVFVPTSQTGLPKSVPMSELVRKTVRLRITEVNQSRRRVVGSIRAVQSDERREKSERVWKDIEVGKKYDGVVKSMTSYGVFVDIGGVDGMIHISELSWTRIKQPSEVMAVGDNVSVHVLSFDKENRKISLGYKKGEDNPWAKFTKQHSIGDVVNVKIVKMMPFGAFAEICPGVDGLIHISQITDHRIGLPSEVLSDGQLVDVKITEIDFDRKKVSLSIRALLDPSSQPVTERDVAKAARSDGKPVIVYDTDVPPQSEDDPDNSSQDPESDVSEEQAEPSVETDNVAPPIES